MRWNRATHVISTEAANIDFDSKAMDHFANVLLLRIYACRLDNMPLQDAGTKASISVRTLAFSYFRIKPTVIFM